MIRIRVGEEWNDERMVSDFRNNLLYHDFVIKCTSEKLTNLQHEKFQFKWEKFKPKQKIGSLSQYNLFGRSPTKAGDSAALVSTRWEELVQNRKVSEMLRLPENLTHNYGLGSSSLTTNERLWTPLTRVYNDGSVFNVDQYMYQATPCTHMYMYLCTYIHVCKQPKIYKYTPLRSAVVSQIANVDMLLVHTSELCQSHSKAIYT